MLSINLPKYPWPKKSLCQLKARTGQISRHLAANPPTSDPENNSRLHVSSRHTFPLSPALCTRTVGLADGSEIKQIIKFHKQRPAERAAFDFVGIEEIHSGHA